MGEFKQHLQYFSILFFFMYLIYICIDLIPDDKMENLYYISLISSLCFIYFLFLLQFPISSIKINLNKREIEFPISILLFSLIQYCIYSIIFSSTDYFMYGISGDAYYRTVMVNNYANLRFGDFFYKGLSIYYSPLYWIILGISSFITKIEPYKMLKIGYIFCISIIPYILYLFWSKILKKETASETSILLMTFVDIWYYYSGMDHIISLMLIVPFILYYLNPDNVIKYDVKDFIKVGVIGSLIFTMFFLYFIVIPLYLLILLFHRKDLFNIKLIKRYLLIGVLIGLFSSWFILPLFIDLFRYGFESHQNLYININWFFPMPFDPFPLSRQSFILFLGMFYILTKKNSIRLTPNLYFFILSVFITVLAGYIMVFLNFPIMHIHLTHLYQIGFVIGFINLKEDLAIGIKDAFINGNAKLVGIESKIIRSIIINRRKMVTIIVSVLLVGQIYSLSRMIMDGPCLSRAQNIEIPEEEISIFEQIPYSKSDVFLTGHYEVMPYISIYVFLSPSPHLSHPAALHNKRVDYLMSLSKQNSSEQLYFRIKNSSSYGFGEINFIYLDKENSTHYKFEMEKEYFPDIEKEVLYLPINLLQNPHYFKQYRIDGREIYQVL